MWVVLLAGRGSLSSVVYGMKDDEDGDSSVDEGPGLKDDPDPGLNADVDADVVDVS